MAAAVLVTGGSGYVAGMLVERLLEGGQTVHTTVRSLRNTKKTGALKRLGQQYPGHLKLFEADLLESGTFDEAMSGCVVVHHVASPFVNPAEVRDGENQFVKPAVEGTRNVLESVGRTATVRRVVLTSSLVAMFGNFAEVANEEGATLRETRWNESSTVASDPYGLSKALAEREAWRICDAQGNGSKRWDLVSINPGLVLGPSQVSSSESGSLALVRDLVSGKMLFGAPNLAFPMVDGRDVAAAHCAAADIPSAHGRYAVALPETVALLDIAKEFRRHASWLYRFLLPHWNTPKWLDRLIGPMFGLSSEFIENHVGHRFAIDNKRSISDLGLKYTPLELTIKDHYNSMLVNK